MGQRFQRAGHGNGAGQPRIELPRPSEARYPVPASLAPVTAPLVFRQDGTIGDSATAKELGRRGGEKKARKVRLLSGNGLARLADDAACKPYWTAAEEFATHHSKELAAMAGGVVGSGPSTMVVSAGLQLGASRYLFDKAAQTGDAAMLKQASALANDSRQNLLAAYELAVREAEARQERGDGEPDPWEVDAPDDAPPDPTEDP